MHVRQRKAFESGYNPITEMNGNFHEMMMDIGVLKLSSEAAYSIDEKEKETAVLLLNGSAELKWENSGIVIERRSLFEESPWCLHVSKNTKITISPKEEAEFIVLKTDNENKFPSKLYKPEDCLSEVFGGGVLNGTSTRTVRTVFDFNNAPYSNLVIGEVINHSGRWSSYPPHDHPQPEVYHYRFIKEQGFGVSVIEDQAFVVKNNDSVCIPPGTVHPQVASPGYPMWYCWMIRHLPNEPFIDRIFRDEHKWLLVPDVKVWPEE